MMSRSYSTAVAVSILQVDSIIVSKQAGIAPPVSPLLPARLVDKSAAAQYVPLPCRNKLATGTRTSLWFEGEREGVFFWHRHDLTSFSHDLARLHVRCNKVVSSIPLSKVVPKGIQYNANRS